MERYAEIVIPVAKNGFTFSIDSEAGIRRGHGIEVNLGANRRYIGIVWRIHDRKPAFATKPAGRIVSDEPLLTDHQMDLWEWIAEYYMCTLGEVMRYALPAGIRNRGSAHSIRNIKYIKLAGSIDTVGKLKKTCEDLRRCKAQYGVLVRICGSFADGGTFGGSIPLKEAHGSPAVIRELERKGIVEIFEKAAENHVTSDDAIAASASGIKFTTELNAAQQQALQDIRTGFGLHDSVLLYGVTGSGKTEIYMELIREMLLQGRSVLYLMPEIAMTSQLVMRVREVFGERVTLYHSQLSDVRRAEIYEKLLNTSGGALVMGVRSSIFLPLNGLGMIIVDEEHDQNYKQTEPAPRYNARDCAVWLSKRMGIKCLLGSATPSIESYVNARNGKYGIAELHESYGVREGEIIVSDSIRSRRRGERKYHFDKTLTDAIGEALSHGKQAVIYHPRRGYASWVECESCGWSARCRRCGVAMTYHKGDDRMICHQCGNHMERVVKCPECGKPEPRMNGTGTEQIEEETKRLFPEAMVVRLDGDTARNTSDTEELIRRFGRGEGDIMIGTQLITKGFDFGGVETIGIISADSMLNTADFRASERAYQQMLQVSGRAGHRGGRGVTVIQTCQPGHEVIRMVVQGDYNAMVRRELEERKLFGYPPYSRLVVIRLRHKEESVLQQAGNLLSEMLRKCLGEQVFGPHTPATEKTGGKKSLEILLKIGNGQSSIQAKKLLQEKIEQIQNEFRGIYVYCDVDPQ